MTLVADSGSTKTAWRVVATGEGLTTEGLNPHFTTDEQVQAACGRVLSRWGQPQTVYFYGAGCGSGEARERMRRLLTEALGAATVCVETDMLGACRALCGHEGGLVGILGTGSNACLYDGRQIVRQSVSTGYILGDHGSANHVGRMLLQDYLTERMPAEVSTMFHDDYAQETARWMEAVYHQPQPNRYLASLAPFALKHTDQPYCYEVLLRSLNDWYTYQLSPLIAPSRDLYLVGGLAARLSAPLSDFCQEKGLTLRCTLADPIERLAAYHERG